MHHRPSTHHRQPRSARRWFRQFSHASASRNATSLILIVALGMLLGLARPALATVSTRGIVYSFFNDPINGLTYGLPFFGNDVDWDPFFPNPNTFEYNAVAGPALPGGGPAANDNEIIVGKGAEGTLLISGGSILRAEDLIVGDVAVVNGNLRGGTGTVRVTGFGSTYNNDPGITALHPSVVFIPPGGAAWPGTIRFNEGNRLILGRGASTGTMDVSTGGSVEIQDAVILGQDRGSIGILTVDGFDSIFSSGGFDMGNPNDLHLMIVGVEGKGFVEVRNGATLVTEASALFSDIQLAASIGSLPFEGNMPPASQQDPGSQGRVAVTGPLSKWILGGSLQVGGFHNVTATGGGPFGGRDFEGAAVQYRAQAASAQLVIADGALVNMRPGIAAPDEPLLLAIGRFGELILQGGTLTQRDAEDGAPPPQLINDGKITGWGRIDTGVFANRYLGEVIIDAGQKLTIASSAIVSTLPGATEIRPLQNYGLMELTGTVDSRAELVIERSPGTTSEPIEPFLNRLLTDQPDPPASRGGLITAEHATLRFGSGLRNESRLAFTGGLNIVRGDVVNFGPPDILDGDIEADVGDFTEILVTGPGTRVNFQNLLAMTGNSDINLANGGNIVAEQDFAADGGEISIELSRTQPSAITVLGDVGLDGIEFNLKLANDIFPLVHGDSFELITFGGGLFGVDVTDPFRPVPDLSVIPTLGSIIAEISVSPATALTAAGLVPVIELAEEGIYALFLDPTMVGPAPGGAMGPDFNGDGVVDAADLAIWTMNVGIESGASVLQGDADGDGDVDGDDLAFWARNVGMPPPWTGAGSGAGGGLGTSVPEPTGLAMLVSAAILALSGRRLRRPA